jgi:hypothetical protein
VEEGGEGVRSVGVGRGGARLGGGGWFGVGHGGLVSLGRLNGIV